MKRLTLAIILSLTALSSSTSAQSKVEKSQMPYSGAPCTAEGGVEASSRQISMFNRFDQALRSALKRNDAAALAFLIHFPLRVNTNQGTLLIPDAASLSGHYGEVFPAEVRSQVLSTSANDYTCRYDEGLGYKAGAIWVSTDNQKFTLDSVNTPDLHSQSTKPSLVYTCETKTHRISIEDLKSGKYRYRSWNKPKELSQAPDVDLSNGELHYEGTGVCSYATYSFTKGNVVYQVNSGMGCGDGTEPAKATGDLNVTVAGKQVTQTWCF